MSDTHPQAATGPLITIGPRVRKSPYFDATVRWGAKAFTVYNHVYMPTHYGDPISEYWSLVNGVTLWDVSCQRQIRISGPDARPFVEYLTPRDLSRSPSHHCLYVLLTDERGGIVNDAVLMHLGGDEYWLSPGDGDVVLWAQGVASCSGMEVEVAEAEVNTLQLQGPKSPHVAYRLFGDTALDLGYYRVVETELQGVSLMLSRTGWSGELGYEIYLKGREHGDWLWETIMAAGEEFGIAPAAPNTIRSIEGALLSYVSDIRREDNPYTFGLERLVQLDKPVDFLGREALRRIHAEGARRRLRGIEIDGESLGFNDSFWPVTYSGETVGHVSRCAWSPRLERNIGFANVPAALASNGSVLTIETPGGPRQAQVVEVPWFPAQKELPADIRN